MNRQESRFHDQLEGLALDRCMSRPSIAGRRQSVQEKCLCVNEACGNTLNSSIFPSRKQESEEMKMLGFEGRGENVNLMCQTKGEAGVGLTTWWLRLVLGQLETNLILVVPSLKPHSAHRLMKVTTGSLVVLTD
jgi:hypothetical protein